MWHTLIRSSDHHHRDEFFEVERIISAPYPRGDKNINYGRVLEIMGTLSGAGFSKVALISEPYKS